MIKKKSYLVFLIGIFLISLISAQTYKVNEELDLKVPFEVNGSVPSSDAWCNVSIQYPNSSYVRNNNLSTNLNNGDFNITLSSSELNVEGEYKWVASCCDGYQCARGYDYFILTPSGFEIDSGKAIGLFGSLILIILIGILFLVIAIRSEKTITKFSFYSFSVIIFIMAILYTVIIIQQTLFGFDSILTGIESFWFVMKSLLTVGIVAFFIIVFLIMLKLWKIKRGLIDE